MAVVWGGGKVLPPTPIYIYNKKPRTNEEQVRDMAATPRQLINVCFTWNNPGEAAPLWNPERMHYLVYQKEIGENGTEHWQGYVEFKKREAFNTIKTLIGTNTVHLEARRGTAKEASDYCQKDDTRKNGTIPVIQGTMKSTAPGARKDLENFKDAVVSGKRKREILDEHFGTLCRYPKFYNTLNLMTRPRGNQAIEVVLHIGEPGLGKTRSVMDRYTDDDELYATPLSNNTLWFDEYDLHKAVLIDDFAGAASKMPLDMLLRLLDRYPVMVPTKGSHAWWKPEIIYITTNILPKDWYQWEKRGVQYLSLARRFSKVVLFYPKLYPEDPGFVEQTLPDWWIENAPQEALPYYP